jgi:glycosyltransferase involved in cell wall biosynthesis
LTWVKNAIDSQFFRRRATGDSEMRQSLKIPGDAVVIGAVGRLNGEKDYPCFFEAAKQLLAERKDLYFTIAGNGALEEPLKTQVQNMGLSDRILFLGHFQDVRQVYEMLDIYVLSSTREGLPNTVLEAMAMEVPIVATDVDGVGEAATHDRDALLVPPRSPKQLAGAIRALLGNPALMKRLTRTARQKVEREFTFAGRMRHVESIYRKVIGAADRAICSAG